MSSGTVAAMTDSWGRWGHEDERGALNLITPDRTVAAAHSVRTGQVYPLGLPIQREGVPVFAYRGPSQRLTLTTERDEHRWSAAGAPQGAGANADLLITPTHNGTHIDALSHVFDDHRVYNGFPSSSFTPSDGAHRCGIDKVGGIVGRGVVLDVAAAANVDHLPETEAVTADMLKAAEVMAGMQVGRGDIVLIHTGWLRHYLDGVREGYSVPLDRTPGLDMGGARYLADRDIAAVGADNPAVEVLGRDGDEFIEVHREMITKRGISFIELLDLREPVADNAYAGMFITAPLRITGGSGSPVNPLLVV